jgi:propanol-preferring alcohol dehydrogenase
MPGPGEILIGGGSDALPSGPLDAAIIVAPVGALVPLALRAKAAASAPKAGVRTEVTRYPLQSANEALADLRSGRLQGAAVLVP